MAKERVIPFPGGRGGELVGGLFQFPNGVLVGGEEVQPLVYLWLEMPRGLLLESTVHHEREPVGVEESLRKALASPIRSAGMPKRIRVADAELAAEIGRIPDMPPVSIAPTPELDEVFSELARSIGLSGVQSYLRRGEINATSVAELFEAATLFLRARPWKVASDQQLIRVDLPDRPIMCALISGPPSTGILLFRSVAAMEWLMTRDPESLESGERVDIPDEPACWTLTFEKQSDLAEEMVREIRENRWPVEKSRCPVLMCVDSYGEPWLPDDEDTRIAAAVTSALTEFVRDFAEVFAEDETEIAGATYGEAGPLEVTISAPFLEDDPEKELEEVTSRRVGRNDPCPCGSGRKYKKCHLREHGTATARPHPHQTEDIWKMNYRLSEQVMAFVEHELGAPVEIPDELTYDPNAAQILDSWVIWSGRHEGEPYARLFVASAQLSPRERAWMESQIEARVSACEVLGAQGDQIDLIDVFTGERRTVTDRKAAPELARRSLILCRIAEWEGTSRFTGIHLRMLPPLEGDRFTSGIRRKFRWGKANVPAERLDDPAVGLAMMMAWSSEINRIDERRLQRPKLTNTDGHPLLDVTDIFTFQPGVRDDIERSIDQMDGSDSRFDLPHDRLWYSIVRDDDTVIANIGIGDCDLFVETNSKKRGTAMRRRLEKLLGSRITHVRRNISEAVLPRPGDPTPTTGLSEPPDDRASIQAARELKERYYTEWLDEPVPALGGRTPRQAAKRAGSRKKVELLLRQMEHDEERLPQEARFDMKWLRQELGI